MPVPEVTCIICQQPYPATDSAVEYRSLDSEWWCADEASCTDRAARAQVTALVIGRHPDEVAAMYRALDAVWDQLERDGWRL